MQFYCSNKPYLHCLVVIHSPVDAMGQVLKPDRPKIFKIEVSGLYTCKKADLVLQAVMLQQNCNRLMQCSWDLWVGRPT